MDHRVSISAHSWIGVIYAIVSVGFPYDIHKAGGEGEERKVGHDLKILYSLSASRAHYKAVTLWQTFHWSNQYYTAGWRQSCDLRPTTSGRKQWRTLWGSCYRSLTVTGERGKLKVMWVLLTKFIKCVPLSFTQSGHYQKEQSTVSFAYEKQFFKMSILDLCLLL